MLKQYIPKMIEEKALNQRASLMLYTLVCAIVKPSSVETTQKLTYVGLD